MKWQQELATVKPAIIADLMGDKMSNEIELALEKVKSIKDTMYETVFEEMATNGMEQFAIVLIKENLDALDDILKGMK